MPTMSHQHQHRRQSRVNNSISDMYGGSSRQPGQPFTPFGAQHTTGYSSSSARVDVPGAYPLWPPLLPPQMPPTSGRAAHVPPLWQGPAGDEQLANPGKRQRFQNDRSMSMSVGPSNGLQRDPPPHRLGPVRLPPPASTFVLNPATPPALLPYNARQWADSAARTTRSHFPHASMSIPLAASPLSRHSHQSSIAITPGSQQIGTAPPRPRPHLSLAHGRTNSIAQRVGPPKAILGGPGGRTFEELRVPSTSSTHEPSLVSTTASSAVPSTQGSRAPSPRTSTSAAETPQSEPPKPSPEPYEVNHMGKVVRVALPPGAYSPPDSPPPFRKLEQIESKPKMYAEGQLPPERVSRRKAFPWPAQRVRLSPEAIPLPASPTEAFAVEAAVFSRPRLHAASLHSLHYMSLDEGVDPVVWQGRGVVVAVPPDQDAWERLRPVGRSISSTESVWATAAEDVNASISSAVDSSTVHRPLEKSDRSSDHSSPPAVIAFEWPSSRSPTPSKEEVSGDEDQVSTAAGDDPFIDGEHDLNVGTATTSTPVARGSDLGSEDQSEQQNSPSSTPSGHMRFSLVSSPVLARESSRGQRSAAPPPVSSLGATASSDIFGALGPAMPLGHEHAISAVSVLDVAVKTALPQSDDDEAAFEEDMDPWSAGVDAVNGKDPDEVTSAHDIANPQQPEADPEISASSVVPEATQAPTRRTGRLGLQAPALRRQLQGFLPADGVVFKPRSRADAAESGTTPTFSRSPPPSVLPAHQSASVDSPPKEPLPALPASPAEKMISGSEREVKSDVVEQTEAEEEEEEEHIEDVIEQHLKRLSTPDRTVEVRTSEIEEPSNDDWVPKVDEDEYDDDLQTDYDGTMGTEDEFSTPPAERRGSPHKQELFPSMLKPSANAFVPRRQRSVPSTPPTHSPPSLVPHERGPSDTSVFTFGPPSVPPSGPPSAQHSAQQAHRRLSSSVSQGESRLRPFASSFHPAIPLPFPQAAQNMTSPPEGGALGLFTFTHNFRPTASAFSPPRAAPESPDKPPALDLWRASPTSPAFDTIRDPFELQMPIEEEGEDMDAQLLAIERAVFPRAQRRVPIQQPNLKPAPPRRDVASPRRSAEPSPKIETKVCPPTEIGKQVQLLDLGGVERPARQGTHTAKRSSQNSHLPRAWQDRSQPASPVKESPTGAVQIHASRPIRITTFVRPQVPADFEDGRDAGLSSTGTFSPIEPVPSEIPSEVDNEAASGTIPSFIVGRPTMSTEEKTLNPAARPFIFGPPMSTPRRFPAVSKSNSFTAPEAGPFEDHFHSTPNDSKTLVDTPPDIHIEPVEEPAGNNRKFREWVFPRSAAGSRASSPSRAAHKRGHSEANSEDDDEFPMRRSSGVLKVVNNVDRLTTELPVSMGDSPLLPNTPLQVDGTTLEVIETLRSLEEQVMLLKMDNDQLAMQTMRRADEAANQTAMAQQALELIRGHLPKPTALDKVASILEVQTELLQEIQRKIEEGTREPTVSSAISVTEEDTTLIEPVPPNTIVNPTELFTALLSGQHALIEKFAEFAEAQDAVYDLRSATDALLEAQTDLRGSKVDHRRAQELAEIQHSLREEVSSTHRAEREVAEMRGRVEELTRRVKDKEDEEVSRRELHEMRNKLAENKEQQHAAIEALKLERDAAKQLAEERHRELAEIQSEAAAYQRRLFNRLDSFERNIESKVDGGGKAKLQSLEQEVVRLRGELATMSNARTDLRVELTQALADVQLGKQQALRTADSEAVLRRNLDLQLKAERARSSFLEGKVQKSEAELHEVNQNLDVWRSAALEQRLRAERSAVHIAAMQQENYHWREFALGADRHRLEEWLAGRPFDGIPGHEQAAPVADKATRPSPAAPDPAVIASAMASPLRSFVVPTIVEPTNDG